MLTFKEAIARDPRPQGEIAKALKMPTRRISEWCAGKGIRWGRLEQIGKVLRLTEQELDEVAISHGMIPTDVFDALSESPKLIRLVRAMRRYPAAVDRLLAKIEKT